LFDNFATHDIRLADAVIHRRVGGRGPPLLLLHGCPQTHVMWHKVIGALAQHFTVVASDLRGYGDSSKPKGLADHSNYSFRAMASDQVALMTRSFGFKSFYAVGHDRGARVLHRMALDHPDIVSRIALLDILPTPFLYAQTDRDFATTYWEWFFFIQGHDFPEQMLSGNPEPFLRYELGDLVDRGVVAPEAWREYLRVLSRWDAVHGMCEDYRAGASVDLEHRYIGTSVCQWWARRGDYFGPHPKFRLRRRLELNMLVTGRWFVDGKVRFNGRRRVNRCPVGKYLLEKLHRRYLPNLEAILCHNVGRDAYRLRTSS
jgi:haloacetate dehalogenase